MNSQRSAKPRSTVIPTGFYHTAPLHDSRNSDPRVPAAGKAKLYPDGRRYDTDLFEQAAREKI